MQEASRVVRSIKIKNPDDDSQYIPLKVIDEISFRDLRFQEYVYSFENGPYAARQVRVESVGDSELQVERIEALSTLDEKERFQQYVWEYLAEEPPRHLVTHDVTIYATDAQGNKNEDVWIKVRRVDKILVLDEIEGFQETEIELDWSTDPEYDYTNLGPLYDQEPPYRIDPFQAIIDASWNDKVALVFYGENKLAALSMAALKRGNFQLLWKKALAQSSFGVQSNPTNYWGNRKQIVARQQKISSGNHITALAGVTITGGVISADTSKGYIVNTAKSLLNGLSLDRTAPDGVSIVFPSGAMFNGSGNSVYTTREDIAVDLEGGLSITQSYDYTDIDDGYQVISPDGDRWGALAGAITIGNAYSLTQSAALSGYNNIASLGPDGESYIGVNIPGNNTLSVRCLSYTRSGGVDALELRTSSATYDVAADPPSTNASWLDFSYYDTVDDAGGNFAVGNTFMAYLGDTPDKMFLQIETFTAPKTTTVNTPYLTRTATSKPAGIFPWLQLSNGEVMVQGFMTYVDFLNVEPPQRHIYIDSMGTTDVLESLATIIGTTADDINSMLLDINAGDAQGIK